MSYFTQTRNLANRLSPGHIQVANRNSGYCRGCPKTSGTGRRRVRALGTGFPNCLVLSPTHSGCGYFAGEPRLLAYIGELISQLLRRTIHAEIIEVEVKRIKSLLVETELALFVIAGRSSFKHAQYMNVMLKKHTGITSGAHRKKYGN